MELLQGVCGGVGNALSQYGEKKGKVLQGSPNVFFESKAVARVGVFNRVF